MACWCETNDKTKSIADAEARIGDLTAKIEEVTANSARLGTEIKNLEKDVAANQAALDQATAIRQKHLADCNAEEKNLLVSISALKEAIVVPSKHHPYSSLLQLPQCLSCIGILKQMKETFETYLAASQTEEFANQNAYEDVKVAMEEEIAAGQAQIDSKTQELADTNGKLATSKQDIEDTRNSLAADEEFPNDAVGDVPNDRPKVEGAAEDSPTGDGGSLQGIGHP